MKNIFLGALAIASLSTSASAQDVSLMIAQCDAPIATALALAETLPFDTQQWAALDYMIASHRRSCATPLTVACAISEAPEDCLAQLRDEMVHRTDLLRTEAEASAPPSLLNFSDAPLFVIKTSEQQANERAEECAMSTGEAAGFAGPFLDDHTMACLTEVSIYQWVLADSAARSVRAFAN